MPKQHQLKAKVVLVTPTLAKDWLQTVKTQRRLQSSTVDHYARIITDGQWKLHGQAIEFDSTGALINGQHRLHAVIKSGKAITCLVVRGTSPDAFDVIDTGRSRTGADILSIKGEVNCTKLATTLTRLFYYDHGGVSLFVGRSGRLRVTNSDLENTLKAYAGVRDCLVTPTVISVGELLASAGYSAALFYLFAQRDEETAHLFYLQLAEGTSLKDTDPAYQLREYLLKQRDKRARSPLSDRVAAVIKAWNLVRAGKRATRQAIIFNAVTEAVPEIA